MRAQVVVFEPTCANTDLEHPGTKFSCPAGYYYKPGSDSLPASEANCCQCKFKCGGGFFGKGKLGKFFPLIGAVKDKLHGDADGKPILGRR